MKVSNYNLSLHETKPDVGEIKVRQTFQQFVESVHHIRFGEDQNCDQVCNQTSEMNLNFRTHSKLKNLRNYRGYKRNNIKLR